MAVAGAAQVLRSPRVPKQTTEEFGFSDGDGGSFEGLASLLIEELGGVTRDEQ